MQRSAVSRRRSVRDRRGSISTFLCRAAFVPTVVSQMIEGPSSRAFSRRPDERGRDRRPDSERQGRLGGCHRRGIRSASAGARPKVRAEPVAALHPPLTHSSVPRAQHRAPRGGGGRRRRRADEDGQPRHRRRLVLDNGVHDSTPARSTLPDTVGWPGWRSPAATPRCTRWTTWPGSMRRLPAAWPARDPR